MKTRTVVPLCTHLDRQLGRYVAAAEATTRTSPDLFTATVICSLGLGSLALFTPIAGAEIVYTPTNQSIGKQNGFSTLPIDLNNDGIADLNLSAYNFTSFSSGFHHFASLEAVAKPGNMILATSHLAGFAAADFPGEMIGAGGVAGRFKADGLMAKSTITTDGGGSSFHSQAGQWLKTKDRYLGVKFSISGEVHYGWARISANPGNANLTGYAYETIANKPILAGATEDSQLQSGTDASESALRNRLKRRYGNLGALARGADGTVRQPNQ
jgi:hypothetical protein